MNKPTQKLPGESSRPRPLYPQARPPVQFNPQTIQKSGASIHPVAPPVYRPQPIPKVLQTKRSVSQSPYLGQAPRPPFTQPVNRPQAKLMVQSQANKQLRKAPGAPPVYRPDQKRIVQPKMASTAPAKMSPNGRQVYRTQAIPRSFETKRTGSSNLKVPAHAPTVQRAYPMPKVLQTKNRSGAAAAARPRDVPKSGPRFPTAAPAQNSFKSVIQAYFLLQGEGGLFIAQQARKTQTGKTFLADSGNNANVKARLGATMRVSNDGKMAIENGGNDRQAKTFYAHPTVVRSANYALLNIGSPVRLATNDRITIQVPNIRRTQIHTLVLVFPVDLRTQRVGHSIRIPQRCNEAGRYVGNTQADYELKPSLNVPNSVKIRGKRIQRSIVERLAVLLPLYLKRQMAQEPLSFGNVFEKGSSDPSSDIKTIETLPVMKFSDLVESKGKGNVEQGMNEIAREYVKNFLQIPGSASILEQLGLNEYADPSVGDLLSIRSLGAPRESRPDWYLTDYASGTELKNPFGYHFATIIAKSGADYITMENYARPEEEGNKKHPLSSDDPRYYFKMFGPREQSFHAEQSSDYPNPMTLRFSSALGPKDYGPQDAEAIRGYNMTLDTKHGTLRKLREARKRRVLIQGFRQMIAEITAPLPPNHQVFNLPNSITDKDL